MGNLLENLLGNLLENPPPELPGKPPGKPPAEPPREPPAEPPREPPRKPFGEYGGGSPNPSNLQPPPSADVPQLTPAQPYLDGGEPSGPSPLNQT